jgi:hypothetical protein
MDKFIKVKSGDHYKFKIMAAKKRMTMVELFTYAVELLKTNDNNIDNQAITIDTNKSKKNKIIRDKATIAKLKELKVERQRKFLISYIASVISDDNYIPMAKTDLKNFIIQNINRLDDNYEKSQDNKEYVPKKLINKEYSSIMLENFTATSRRKKGIKKPIQFVDKINAKEFLSKHKDILELPKIYNSITDM